MVILKLWMDYYVKYFDKLFVIGNYTREDHVASLEEFQRAYPMDFYILPSGLGTSEHTLSEVKERMGNFLKEYDWVLYTDCDEIVVTDPKRYTDLKDLMNRTTKRKIFCEGYDIIQAQEEGPIDYDKPYLAQRKYWSKNVSYNKPVMGREMINWNPGFHKEYDMDDNDSKAIVDTGVYLLHLKYADLGAERDFGPIRTGLHGDDLERALETKEIIPTVISTAF